MVRFGCLFFILCAATALAQVSVTTKLNGRVIADVKDFEGFYVINLKTEQGTVTDGNGYFSIAAVVGDTLLFSASQYKGIRIVLTTHDFEQEPFSVQMEPIVNQLNEVVIRHYDNINAVSLGIIPANQKSYTAAEGKYATASSVGLNPMGLDPIINLFSGRTAMLKKELKIEKKESYLKQLDDMFDKNHFVNKLKIPLDYVKGFEYYAVENEQFTKILSSKSLTSTEFLLAELATKYNEIIACENE